MKQIRNHKKIKDLSKTLTGFENLARAFIKARPVIDKEENGITPRFYIRCLVELEDFINELWEDREGRKSMSKNNSKSLGTLRQKLKKYNKDFETDIASYRENPEIDQEEDDEAEKSDDESSSGSEIDFVGRARTTKPDDADDEKIKEEIKSKFLKDSSVEDSDEWPSSTEESSSSSDDEAYENLAAKFLKKTDEKKPEKREKKVKVTKESKKKEGEALDDDDWQKVKGGVVTEKPKMFAKDAEINHQVMLKKFIEVISMRGKKRVERTDQIDMLGELLAISQQHNLGPAMEVKILFGIIGAFFDYNPNVATCMKNEMWEKCLETTQTVIDVLIANPDIAIGENIAEESEQFKDPPLRVHGSPLALIERLDEEFTKMLQGCDAHSPDYIERLKDETRVVQIIDTLQSYLETNGRGTSSELCRVYILKIDHLYYKFDPGVFEQKEKRRRLEEAQNGQINGEFKKVEIVIADAFGKELNKVDKEIKETSMDVMDRLCKYIYAKDTTDRIRTQAMLCHIYHHALHDNWFEARDLMLMSHLQHNIGKSDIPLQIIYNRALVQLGLCSFRHGNIKDAHTALLDIQIQGRAKELLAQGTYGIS